MQLARRSVGLSYSALPCNDYFIRFCETLFSYQYVAHPAILTPEMIELLYECTGGIIAVLVSVIMEAQQMAILTGREELSKETVLAAYQERLKNVQDFVKVRTAKRSQTSASRGRCQMEIPEKGVDARVEVTIAEMLEQVGEKDMDVAELLRGQGIFVEEAV